MKMKLLLQSLTLILSFAFVFILISTTLTLYIAPILGVLIAVAVIYLVIKQRTNRGKEIIVGSNLEVFAINTALLLALFLTGGLYSNLFFLLYFLFFGIVFLFEPATVFVLLIGVFAIFIPSIAEGDLFANIAKLGSLAILSPLSFFFGREFQRRENADQEIKDKAGQIMEDAQTLKKKGAVSEDEMDEIEDIIDQTNEIRKKVDDEK